jgi:hypothetical protein
LTAGAPARRFYERFGFLASPTHPLTLMLPLRDASAQLSDRDLGVLR